MAIQSEVDRLLQTEWRENVIPQLGRKPREPWIAVYRNDTSKGYERLVWYSGLVPNEHIAAVMDSPKWEYRESDPVTSFTGDYDRESGEDTGEYHRFGPNKFDIEPLIVVRGFSGLKPAQLELIEEFRLYHNLWFDEKRSCFVKFDAGGNEKDVARLSDGRVDVRRLELRQFLAARDLSLVVYFDRRYEPGHRIEIPENQRFQRAASNDYRFEFKVIDGHDLIEGTPETYSWFRGKKIIGGLPREKCGAWPYDEEPVNVLEDFVIGVDQLENDILAYSSPYSHGAATTDLELPAEYDVPEYLTPVFFNRRVLKKYRDEPSKYSVADGSLKCGNTLWRLDIDNNNPDFVIVWLGDLGRDLPYTEHKHWKDHNVPPEGRMSDSHLRAQLPATVDEALDPGLPEDCALRFIHSYRSLSEAWQNAFGWDLFKPLRDADSHHLATMRRPLTQEQSELDEILLSLSKLLVDSINSKQLKNLIADFCAQDERGKAKASISILEEFLNYHHLENTERFISCLRNIQALRSTGAAHRRSDNFEKIAKTVGLDSNTKQQVADEIFTTLTEFLNSLREYFCSEDSDYPVALRS